MKEQNHEWPAGLKRTQSRESVLAVLEGAQKPLSAMEICVQIEKSGKSAWLSTVYRTLELFEKKGLVVKIALLGGETALYELNRFEHKHYAVCLACHKIIPMDNCPMERFLPSIKDAGFRVMGHNLEIYGYCNDCDTRSGSI